MHIVTFRVGLVSQRNTEQFLKCGLGLMISLNVRNCFIYAEKRKMERHYTIQKVNVK